MMAERVSESREAGASSQDATVSSFDFSITVHSLKRRFERKAKDQPTDITQQSLYWARVKWLGSPSRFRTSFLSSSRKKTKEESAHLFDDESGNVLWEHVFKSRGVSLQHPLKKHPWEVQLAVFESRPGCAESQKIGQVILNMASYAGKEQKLVLPINGGFSSGELSITLSVQAAQAGIAGPNPPSTAPEALNMFGWTRTKSKQLLSSLKRTYATGLGKEERPSGGLELGEGEDGAGLPIDGRREERGEPGGAPAEAELAGKNDKGHKRKPSRSLFARMLQDSSNNSSDVGGTEVVSAGGEGEVVEKGARKIPERKRTKSNPDLMPINSPGQLAAIEMVRKFQEGRNPIKSIRKLEGLWEHIEIDGLLVDICFASIDQCSAGVDGFAACSTLAVGIASWMKLGPSPVPDGEGELDKLIREGSKVWRDIFHGESGDEMREKFPDMHLDLETAAEEWMREKGGLVSIDAGKSFVGFLMPKETPEIKSLREATKGFLTFDRILKEAMDAQDSIYIVAWNDHSFVLRICSPDLIYLVDTLGVRLHDGCSKAFIVRFETEEGTEETKQPVLSSTAGEKCKAFFQSILAKETLDEVVNNLNVLELTAGADGATGGVEGDEIGDEKTPEGEDRAESEAGGQKATMEWQFLLGRLQLELQFVG